MKYIIILVFISLSMLAFVIYIVSHPPTSNYESLVREKIELDRQMLQVTKQQILLMVMMISYFEDRSNSIENIVRNHSDYIGGQVVKNKVKK